MLSLMQSIDEYFNYTFACYASLFCSVQLRDVASNNRVDRSKICFNCGDDFETAFGTQHYASVCDMESYHKLLLLLFSNNLYCYCVMQERTLLSALQQTARPFHLQTGNVTRSGSMLATLNLDNSQLAHQNHLRYADLLRL